MTDLPTKHELTPNQQKIVEIARVGAMSQSPFYANFFYSEMSEHPTIEGMPTAATDGIRLFFNPIYLETLVPAETIFVWVHEIQHAVRRHPQRLKYYAEQGTVRGLPFDDDFYNICADWVINADLVENKIGQINPDWLYNPHVVGTDHVEDVYVKYFKQRKQDDPTWGSSGRAGRGQKGDERAKAAGGRFDKVLTPRRDPITGRVEETSDGAHKEAVARAAAAAKAMGKLPASIERLVKEFLAPQVNWRDHVRMLLTGRLGHRHETWSRPNRRRVVLNPIVYLPGKRGYGADTVACVIDNSGSISQHELDAFLAEVGGVLQDVRPRQIVVIWCDAQVQRTEHVLNLDELGRVMAKPTRGGGGTSFKPPFRWLKDQGVVPDTLIYLTDMYGDFPEEPTYPVVWCATTDKKAPFGDHVRIKL